MSLSNFLGEAGYQLRYGDASVGFRETLFEMFVEPFKKGLEEVSLKLNAFQILDKTFGRDNSGWYSSFKIDGVKVTEEDYQTEIRRVCLWKTHGGDFDRGYSIPEGNLVLREDEITVQHFSLPFYYDHS